MGKKVYGKRLGVAIIFPNGAKANGLAIVTGERWDGCLTVTLPSQQVNFTATGEIVETWPEVIGKPPDGDTAERMAIEPFSMAATQPLGKWSGNPWVVSRYHKDLFGLRGEPKKAKR